jgi:hypothetical protein
MTSALNINVFTAPEQAIAGERPRPWGPPMAWDATTATLIFGENDAVLVGTLTTIDEAEALARRVELHHRNPKSVELMPKAEEELAVYRKFFPGQLPAAITVPGDLTRPR